VLPQGLVAVWHEEGRLFKNSLVLITDPKKINCHKLGCIWAHKNGLGLQSIESGIDFPELLEHLKKVPYNEITILADVNHVVDGLPQVQLELDELHLQRVRTDLQSCEVGQVIEVSVLGHEGQPDGGGDLVWLGI
jgi:hypothetical protein